jgi:hypothetical protein
MHAQTNVKYTTVLGDRLQRAWRGLRSDEVINLVKALMASQEARHELFVATQGRRIQSMDYDWKVEERPHNWEPLTADKNGWFFLKAIGAWLVEHGHVTKAQDVVGAQVLCSAIDKLLANQIPVYYTPAKDDQPPKFWFNVYYTADGQTACVTVAVKALNPVATEELA